MLTSSIRSIYLWMKYSPERPAICLHCKSFKHVCVCVCLTKGCWTPPPPLWSFTSTLVIGGAGSLMLDLYGWQSIFYASGLLSVLWAYCMWKYLLRGEGKGGVVFTRSRINVANWRSSFMCSGAHVLVFVCRAHHHPGGPGKWWRPVHAVQKALVEAPQATCSLVRGRVMSFYHIFLHIKLYKKRTPFFRK